MYLSDKKFYTFIGAGAIIASLVLINYSLTDNLKKIVKLDIPKDNKFGIVAGESVWCVELLSQQNKWDMIGGTDSFYGDKYVYKKTYYIDENDTSLGRSYGIYIFDLNSETETLIAQGENPTFYEPSIYGDTVALRGAFSNDHQDLYIYQNNNLTKVTSSTSKKERPFVYGNYVVYKDYTEGISLLNLTNNEISVIDDFSEGIGEYPQMYENYIVWQERRDGFSLGVIILYDITTGNKTIISDEATKSLYPVIHQNYIAYATRTGSGYKMATYNIQTQETHILTESTPYLTYMLSEENPIEPDGPFPPNSYFSIYNGYLTYASFGTYSRAVLYDIKNQEEYYIHLSNVTTATGDPKIYENIIIYSFYEFGSKYRGYNKINLDCIFERECSPDEIQDCGTDVGECQIGTQACQYTAMWGECTDSIEPIEEICNDELDNDCDGEIDEGCCLDEDQDGDCDDDCESEDQQGDCDDQGDDNNDQGNSGGGDGGGSNNQTSDDNSDEEEDTATTTEDIIEDEDTATTTNDVIEEADEDEDDQGEDEDGQGENEDEEENSEPQNVSLPGYGTPNGGSSDTTTYIIIKDKRKGLEIKVREEEQEVVKNEKELVEQVDQTVTSKYAGRIILPEDMDEIWYVEPASEQKFYLNDNNSAYNVMQIFGLGISNENLAKIPIGILDEADIVDSDGDGLDDKLEESLGTDIFNPDTDNDGYLDGTEVKYSYHPKAIGKFPYQDDYGKYLAGKILIQVESKGEAWYVNPDDGKRYYLKDGYAAYQILNMLSSQISTDDLRKIDVGEF